MQSGKSFPAKELQVLVATEAKERELVARTLILCFYFKSEDILCIKLLYSTVSSIWIVRATEVPDNFHCVEFKIEIDQVLICKCLLIIKNGRDEIDKNGVFKIIEHFQI